MFHFVSTVYVSHQKIVPGANCQSIMKTLTKPTTLITKDTMSPDVKKMLALTLAMFQRISKTFSNTNLPLLFLI
jgi:hypothetical protein